MTPLSDSDGWYDPDSPVVAMLRRVREAGEYRRSDPPTPIPEGMETTAEEREDWAQMFTGKLSEIGSFPRLLRDFDRALAEIARLTAINGDLCAVNLRHAEARARIAELEAALKPFSFLTKLEQIKTDIVAENDLITVVVRVGDIDAARAALSGEGVKT